MLTTTCTINFGKQITPPIVQAVQGDSGRAVNFTLSDITIPDGATATYYVQKPSGEAVYNNATISGNNVIVEFTPQALAEYGECPSHVRILSDGEVVTSFAFILLVRKFFGDGAIESTTEMNIFDKAVADARERIGEVLDRTLTKRDYAAEAKATGDKIAGLRPLDYGFNVITPYSGMDSDVWDFGISEWKRGAIKLFYFLGAPTIHEDQYIKIGNSNYRILSGGDNVRLEKDEIPANSIVAMMNTASNVYVISINKGPSGWDKMGSYPDLTAGSASQLLSDTYTEESVPYLKRTTGGDVEVGDRLEEVIVGGSVVWNQLVQNGNFASTSNWSGGSGTLSVANNVARLTIGENAYNNHVKQATISLTEGHKYFSGFDYLTSEGLDVDIALNEDRTNTSYAVFPYSTTRKRAEAVFSATSSNSGFRVINTRGVSGYSGQYFEVSNFTLFDLTQMFGQTIADHIYQLEQSTAGAGVAFFRKLFPDDYYAYDAGTIKHVSGLQSHVTVGKNLLAYPYSEETATRAGITQTVNADGSIHLSGTATATSWFKLYGGAVQDTTLKKPVPDWLKFGTSYVLSGGQSNDVRLRINLYNGETNIFEKTNSSGDTIFTIPKATIDSADSCGVFLRVESGQPVNTTVYPMIRRASATDATFEPYTVHTYPLDSSLTLRGIPKLVDGKLAYDGDRYLPDGTVVRRYGVVDLGTLSWSSIGDNKFYANVSNALNILDTKGVPYVCTKYPYQGYTHAQIWTDHSVDGLLIGTSYISQTPRVYVHDSAYTDAASFKTAMSGVLLVYELAIPTTESAKAYTSPQVVSPYGTEEYVLTSGVPVGHESRYLADLKGKLEALPDKASTDGDYIIRQTDGKMELVEGGSTYYGICDTAAATTAKTVTVNSTFKLKTGVSVKVQFANTNSGAVGSLTLNVNGTGAKAIKYRNSTMPSAGALSAGGVYEFIYDGTYWRYVGDVNTDTTPTPTSLGFAYGTCSASGATRNVSAISSSGLKTGSIIAVYFTAPLVANQILTFGSNSAQYSVYRNGSRSGMANLSGVITMICDGNNLHILSYV